MRKKIGKKSRFVAVVVVVVVVVVGGVRYEF